MRTYHDTTDAMAAIEAMAERLRDDYGAEAVILYGSRANGSARPDSDIDLLIIKSKDAAAGSFGSSIDVNSGLSDLRQGLTLDARIFTPDQVAEVLARGDHFIQDIILNGKAIHKSEGFAEYIELAEKSYNMNPQDSEYSEDWIRNAEEDYRMALYLLEGDFPRGAGYNLQQATEKFFKAYLIRQGWRLQRTHDLVELLDDALQYDSDLEEFRSVCKLVTDYTLVGRYPTSRDYVLPVMDDENVRAALAEIAPLLDLLRAGSAKPDSAEADDNGTK